MTALAALEAKDDSGEAIASKLIEVSKDGTQCTGWEECSALVEKGEDIDYQGASGPIDMNDTGSPTKGTIGIYQYGKPTTSTRRSTRSPASSTDRRRSHRQEEAPNRSVRGSSRALGACGEPARQARLASVPR